jgi:hypothetical protein
MAASTDTIKVNALRRVLEVTGSPTVQALARAMGLAEEEYGAKVRRWRVEWVDRRPKVMKPGSYVIEAAMPFDPPKVDEE